RCSRLARSFFFQAEDGIRDGHVTGVQTCALPICEIERRLERPRKAVDDRRRRTAGARGRHQPRAKFDDGFLPDGGVRADVTEVRSEERRVGKECRSRWASEHQKKKSRSRRTAAEK